MNKQQVDILFQLLRDYLMLYLPKQRCLSENTIKSYRDTWNLLLYLTGKGGKRRVVPIMSKTVQHYLKYRKLFLNDNDQGQLIFYTVCHGLRMQMSDDNVARFLKQYAKSAMAICDEVPDSVHPHMFRHGRAMSLYRNGMPLALLSEFLGHENPETTLVYAYADTEMKRLAIEKATDSTNPIHAEVDALWINNDEMIKKLYGLG